jgi:hypothetical protein
MRRSLAVNKYEYSLSAILKKSLIPNVNGTLLPVPLRLYCDDSSGFRLLMRHDMELTPNENIVIHYVQRMSVEC